MPTVSAHFRSLLRGEAARSVELTDDEPVGPVQVPGAHVFTVVEDTQNECVRTVDVGHLGPSGQTGDDAAVGHSWHTHSFHCQ